MKTRTAVALLALVALAAACNPAPAPAPADKADPAGSAAPAGPASAPPVTTASADCALTPVGEGAERAAILDAVRPQIEAMAGKPVEFVVNRLETACDYARLIAQPQSKGGADRYESIDALFVRTDGKWTLSMIASGEEGSDPAADQYKKKHADAPEALLYL